MAKNGHSKFFSNNFPQKEWYKFGMAKNGCSKYFLTFFPKKTGINSEWAKMGYNYGHVYGQSPIQTVPACPIQIRAHHHIDVSTNINNS